MKRRRRGKRPRPIATTTNAGTAVIRSITGPHVPLYTLDDFLQRQQHFQLQSPPAELRDCVKRIVVLPWTERAVTLNKEQQSNYQPHASLQEEEGHSSSVSQQVVQQQQSTQETFADDSTSSVVIQNPYTTVRNTQLLQQGPRQSLSSLVDHVVWTCVQRKANKNNRAAGNNNNNILATGFRIGGSSSRGTTTTAAVLVQTHLNPNVDAVKTNPVLQWLHATAGDCIVRTLLLDCSLFCPLRHDDDDDDSNNSNNNYRQLTGPPIGRTKPVLSLLHPTSRLNDQRKRFLLYRDAYQSTVGGRPPWMQSKLLLLDYWLRDLWAHHDHDIHTDNSHQRWILLLRRADKADLITRAADVVHRFKRTDFHRLLDRYCPLPTVYHDTEQSTCNDPNEWLAQFATCGATPHAQVTSWLRAVTARVLGPLLQGTNEHVILGQLLPRYVSLHRDEAFANKTLLHGLKVTQFTWLASLASFDTLATTGMKNQKKRKMSSGDHERLKLLVLSFLRWFFSDFVLNMLRSAFYVTTTEFSGRELHYYRKPVWAKFRSLSLQKLSSGQYKEITERDASHRLTVLGLSKLRLVPKKSGVRPIATLCRQEAQQLFHRDSNRIGETLPTCTDSGLPWQTVRGKAAMSTNAVLSDAFAILKHEHSRDDSSFGRGLEGLHYFYPRYRKFLRRRRQDKIVGKLFFGSADIKHCFDSINQDRLLEVVKDLLKGNQYILHQYQVVTHSQNAQKVIKKRKKQVQLAQQYRSFSDVASELVSSIDRSVLVAGVSCATSRKDELLALLRQHLFHHVVVTSGRYGSRYFRQRTGIPQGSVLSSLLCNFYYGNVEPMLFPSTQHEDTVCNEEQDYSLAVRMVDDFMTVSTNRETVVKFLKRMNEGAPKYGIVINREKTKSSFPTGQLDVRSEVHKDQFPWCGMLFHCQTGEVQIDYGRLLENDISGSFSLELASSEGSFLLLQMKTFVYPRCLPILFDKDINSRKTQVLNFYQLVLLAAVKTLLYLRRGQFRLRTQANNSLISQHALATGKYALDVIRHRLKAEDAADSTLLSHEVAHKLTQKSYWDACRATTDYKGLANTFAQETNEELHRHLLRQSKHILAPLSQ